MIEAVLFDGDQTLWDFERIMREALVATAAELRAARPGPCADALGWGDLQADRAAVAAESPDVWSLAELRVLGFARTLARRRDVEDGDEAADEVLAHELGDSYFAHRDRDPALFPDTVPGLDALRADYRLGLLSNGSRLPETVGLAGYFESVVFAQDHRVAKPDKGIFEVAESELGVGPEVCVLVGDHPVNDVAGAHGAGWRSVWLDRDGAVLFPDHGPRPDAVVASLAELPELLPRPAAGSPGTFLIRPGASAGQIRRRWRTCRAPLPRRSVRPPPCMAASISMSATPSAVAASNATELDWPSASPMWRRASAQNPALLFCRTTSMSSGVVVASCVVAMSTSRMAASSAPLTLIAMACVSTELPTA